MPPRRPDAAPRFWATVTHLMTAHPDFMSITYGAAGQDRQTSRDVVARLLQTEPVPPIAHLTCVGASQHGVEQVVTEFLDAGARSFLALRGDPPSDQPGWQPEPGGVASSLELLALLRQVHRGHPASADGPLTIAVAAFPAGNPAAGTTREQEVAQLFAKQAAGADFAITQLFYEPEVYIEFVADARAAGVVIPIVAGILPITDPVRLSRVESLTGVAAPPEMVRVLEAVADPVDRLALGVDLTAKLARDVLDAGAPGLHIYTFNQHEPALALLARLGWAQGQR